MPATVFMSGGFLPCGDPNPSPEPERCNTPTPYPVWRAQKRGRCNILHQNATPPGPVASNILKQHRIPSHDASINAPEGLGRRGALGSIATARHRRALTNPRDRIFVLLSSRISHNSRHGQHPTPRDIRQPVARRLTRGVPTPIGHAKHLIIAHRTLYERIYRSSRLKFEFLLARAGEHSVAITSPAGTRAAEEPPESQAIALNILTGVGLAPWISPGWNVAGFVKARQRTTVLRMV